MMPPSPVAPPTDDDLDLSAESTALLRRRLRHASVLLAAAEPPGKDRLGVLVRARGHLAATLRSLDRLVAEVRGVPVPVEEELTERIRTDRIPRIP
jgi:hypothetical protein